MSANIDIPETERRLGLYLQERHEEKYENNTNWDQTEDRFRASSLCNPCARKTYFDIKDPTDNDHGSMCRMHVGTMIHELVQGLYPELEQEVDIEVEVDSKDTGFTITGHCDMMDKDEDMIIELKSCLFFAKAMPYPAHIRQLMFYMGGLGRKKGTLEYIQKGDLAVRLYEYDFDEELYQSVIDTGRAIRNAFITGEAPPMTTGEKRDNCKWCNHKATCKAVEKGE